MPQSYYNKPTTKLYSINWMLTVAPCMTTFWAAGILKWSAQGHSGSWQQVATALWLKIKLLIVSVHTMLQLFLPQLKLELVHGDILAKYYLFIYFFYLPYLFTLLYIIGSVHHGAKNAYQMKEQSFKHVFNIHLNFISYCSIELLYQ